MRVVPLHTEFAEALATVAFAAPAGLAAKQRLTTLRITIWMGLPLGGRLGDGQGSPFSLRQPRPAHQTPRGQRCR
eukprot:6720224-Alexandrium_andersonii.AAC.1